MAKPRAGDPHVVCRPTVGKRARKLGLKGKTDELGVPDPALLADLLGEFNREIAPATPERRA